MLAKYGLMNLSEDLRRVIDVAIAAFKGISEQEWTMRTSPDKWSKKEILGHLVDSAYNNHPRIMSACVKEDLKFEGYAQDDWVTNNNYQNRDSQELIHLWKYANLHLSHLIEGLPSEILDRGTVHHNFDQMLMRPFEKESPATLRFLIEDYIFHIEHHLKQIVIN